VTNPGPLESGDESDDDALRWAGDEDRGRERPRLSRGTSAEDPATAPVARNPRTAQRGTLPTAIFAVLYLALTLGWVLSVQRTSSGTTAVWTELLWQFGEFMAIVAAPLWFGVTVALSRDSRVGIRVGWLALGAAVLVPWPLILGLFAALSLGALS
jgi:hypothetical protein